MKFFFRTGVLSSSSFPYLVLAFFAGCFVVVPLMAGTSISTGNLLGIGQNFATYGPLALGLALLMIAREFDLSVAALYGLGAMLAVKTGEESPLLGVAIAVALAALVGLANGMLITLLNLNSVAVTLGAYVAVSGLLVVISGNSSIPYGNYDFAISLDSPIATVFSVRSLVAIALFVIAGLVLGRTRWGRDLRATGGDRRASRVAGIRVRRLLIITFVISAMLAALPGALLGYSLASASPEYGGFSTLVFAVTAVLVGGVSLSGGQGTVLGVTAGVLSLALLEETLAIVAAPLYATSLITGGLLVVIGIVAAPHLLRGALARRWINSRVPEGSAAVS